MVTRAVDITEAVLTTGHPHYDCWPTEFRFGLDNILVCTKSADGII